MKTTVERIGPMAFSAVADSGHTVIMDASAEAGGEDRGVRPMEMILMGLGGCTSIDVVMILEKARQDIQGCKVEITAERAQTDPKIYTYIHIHFIVSGQNLSSEKVARAIELSADKYCSVSIMLGKMVRIEHDFEIVEV
jgi:putative redox protein